eukprot:15444273-Alexandrium_andersonii.AAC.1
MMCARSAIRRCGKDHWPRVTCKSVLGSVIGQSWVGPVGCGKASSATESGWRTGSFSAQGWRSARSDRWTEPWKSTGNSATKLKYGQAREATGHIFWCSGKNQG